MWLAHITGVFDISVKVRNLPVNAPKTTTVVSPAMGDRSRVTGLLWKTQLSPRMNSFKTSTHTFLCILVDAHSSFSRAFKHPSLQHICLSLKEESVVWGVNECVFTLIWVNRKKYLFCPFCIDACGDGVFFFSHRKCWFWKLASIN